MITSTKPSAEAGEPQGRFTPSDRTGRRRRAGRSPGRAGTPGPPSEPAGPTPQHCLPRPTAPSRPPKTGTRAPPRKQPSSAPGTDSPTGSSRPRTSSTCSADTRDETPSAASTWKAVGRSTSARPPRPRTARRRTGRSASASQASAMQAWERTPGSPATTTTPFTTIRFSHAPSGRSERRRSDRTGRAPDPSSNTPCAGHARRIAQGRAHTERSTPVMNRHRAAGTSSSPAPGTSRTRRTNPPGCRSAGGCRNNLGRQGRTTWNESEAPTGPARGSGP